MKVLKFKDIHGKMCEGYLQVSTYVTGGMALIIYTDPAKDGIHAVMTVRLSDGDSEAAQFDPNKAWNYAYVDTNIFPEAIKIIEDNELGTFTREMLQSGDYVYPLYAFNMKKIREYAND